VACRRVGALGGLPRRGPPTRTDPAGPVDIDVRRLQRLGWPVALHRRNTGLDAPPDGARLPGQARATPAQDAAGTRPRGAVVLRVGGAARPVGLERRRRLVEL